MNEMSEELKNKIESGAELTVQELNVLRKQRESYLKSLKEDIALLRLEAEHEELLAEIEESRFRKLKYKYEYVNLMSQLNRVEKPDTNKETEVKE